MEKKLLITLAIFIGLFAAVHAQETTAEKPAHKTYFKFQPRIKIGAGQTLTALPIRFDDVTIHRIGVGDTLVSGLKNDFLKTNWGPYTGANFDFYFHPNLGFGLDLDYWNNKVKFETPQLIKDFMAANPESHLVESNRKNQNFVFLGIGPSFKLFTNEHWDVDLNVRVGLSHLEMGSLSETMDSVRVDNRYPRKTVLVYDYNKSINTLGLKGGLYVNYWFNTFVGLSLGVDFVHSFIFNQIKDNQSSYVLQYKDPKFFTQSDRTLNEYAYFHPKSPIDDYTASAFNINHIAVSAGVVFKVTKVGEVVKKEKNKDIIVLVKDSLTGIPVAGVDVNLKDKKGLVIQTKKTVSNGKVTFLDISPSDYSVSGTKGELFTNKALITQDEFAKRGKAIYKELLLGDHKFILSGVSVECDKKDKAIAKVNIELTNKSNGSVQKATSDDNGVFTFNLEPNTDYSIVGSRDGFYSGVQELTTKGLDRSKTLYVKLKLCVEQLEVGKSFILKNIYYDFDKCNIRKDASVELNHLVDIMNKYPTMVIELSSHTDQRGTDEYNKKLSQCRAESAVEFVIGRGISKDRISAVGYGKSKPIEDCTKVEGCPQTSQGDCPCHQNNRRTEVKILKM